MCGIAGIYGKGNIEEMVKTIHHRGPDSTGFYKNNLIQIGVARLSIIDRVTGDQPIYNEDKTKVIVFNGEIYNYSDLKKTLIKNGHKFYTKTDTEVILHAYEEWGFDCLKMFNGMFAFAIWDNSNHVLFIARDRLGIKPLYWAKKNNNFLFASEIKAILKEKNTIPNITEDFFCFETPIYENTLFKDIFNLLPGHFLTFNGKSLQIHKYWNLNLENYSSLNTNDAIDHLNFLIKDSINIRTKADVPVGTFLSGGIDSTIITTLGQTEDNFTCNFDCGKEFNELHYASITAKNNSFNLHIIKPKAKDLEENFSKIIYHLDYPIATASSIAKFMLSKEAAKYVKVLLVGEGADEIFGGYLRYLIFLNTDSFRKISAFKHYLPLYNYYKKLSKTTNENAYNYFQLIKRNENDNCLKYIQPFFSTNIDILKNMQKCDIDLLLPSLLQMNDRALSAFGLENRVPYLDHRIVEFAFSLKPDIKIRFPVTKYILRESVKGLISEKIRKRKDKKGLVVPINNWLNNELKSWCDSKIFNLKKRGFKFSNDFSRGNFDRNKYNYLSLEIWLEIFFPDFEV